MRIEVCIEKISKISQVLSKVLKGIKPDPFTDPRYYPPKNEDPESVSRFFFFMVAIDHRVSRPSKPYIAEINGEVYEGADLLYRLGKITYDEDPSFFDPNRLKYISAHDIKKKFDISNAAIPDPETRAELLRDAATKLLEFYKGEVINIIKESKNFLKHKGRGFIERLRIFKAYSDPVEKKSYLLAKFLERRKILEVKDWWNAEVPVDNHLVRIAFRLNLVTLDKETENRIRRYEEFKWHEDVEIRLAIRLAYKHLSKTLGISPFYLDDFLWLFGKRCCNTEKPVCKSRCNDKCYEIKGCIENCIFLELCKEANATRPITEYNYYSTWYY